MALGWSSWSILRRVALVLGVSLGIGAGGTSCAAADSAALGLPVVFSVDQAKRGRQIFTASCADCHGADLEGVVGPALAGPAFVRRWEPPERSADDLFYVLRTSMPKLAMGSLGPDDYLAVFAYLLQRNGWPAGSRPFDGSDTLLRRIRFDALSANTGLTRLAAPDVIRGGGSPPADAGPSQAELMSPDSADWLYHTGDFSGARYSRLGQLGPANVAQLAVACVAQVGSPETFQTGPVVYRGVMYLTTVRQTVAIDAATCRPR